MMQPKSLTWVVAVLLFVLVLVPCVQAESYSYVTQWDSSGSCDGRFNLPYAVAVDNSGNVYVADTSNHRIQKFSSDGTFETKWGTSGSGDGQFNFPEGVAVDSSGNVYVADKSNNRIQKFDSTGAFITKWGTSGSGDGQFNFPHDIAVDSSGNVYVADTSNNRIQKFDSSGAFITKWGSLGSNDGQFSFPEGVAVDSSGNVYVSDWQNDRIQKFDSSGTFITKWGSHGSGDGQLNYPEGIAVDSSGNVYVVDAQNHRIQKFSSTGVFATTWGSDGSGNGQFHFPQGVAVDSSGNVYVADPYNYRIQKFTSGGTYVTQWGSYGMGDGRFTYPYGLAVGPSGLVYVADTGNNRIQEFTPGGTFGTMWGSYGSAIGQFDSPFGIAVDSSDNRYVAEAGNDRIQKFKPGTTTTILTGFTDPIGVGVDASGNVYIADTYNDRIVKFTSAGAFEREWNSEGTAAGKIDEPVGVAVSGTSVYVVERAKHRVQKFTSDGTYLTHWGSFGSGDYQFKSPGGIAVDSAGNVYVADTGNPRIQKFTSDGVYVTQWGSSGSGDGQFNAPQGVAVDASGYVYVADTNNHRIQKFAPTSAAPNADYTVDTYFGVSPLTVIFTDTSTGIPTPPTSVSIDFGDGDSADIIPPGTSVSHTFSSPGTYKPVITACNGGGGCDSQTKATISVIYSGLDPGLVAACKLTLDDPTILNGNAVDKLMFGQELGQGPKTLELFGGESFELPDEAGYLISIDYFPQANYEHKIVFAYVSKTDPMVILQIIEASSPSTNYANPILILGVPPEPDGFISSPTLFTGGSNSLTGDGGDIGGEPLLALAEGAMCAPDCSHYYALLISGGVQKEYNYARYRNDIEFLYKTLTEKYGYPESHITVLVSDGTDPGADQLASYTDNTPNYANSITDFDNDQSPEVKDTPVTRTNVINTLRELRDTLEPEDNLFILTTNHGGLITDPSIPDPTSKEVILYLWGTTDEGWITDEEFVNELPGSPLYPGTGINSITMVMEQCFGGGFIDNFIGQYQGSEKRMIGTAANWNEYSWGNAYSFQWISGMDGNRYSMQAAHENARDNDPYFTQYSPPKENPQFSSYPTPDAGSNQYLAECSVTPSVDVIVPATTTWYTQQTPSIIWNQVALSGKTVNIELWKGTPGTMILPIASVPLNNEITGTYLWYIPPTLTSGRDYWIKISEPQTGVSDRSDGSLTITKVRTGTTTTGKLWINSTPVPNLNAVGALIFIGDRPDVVVLQKDAAGNNILTNASFTLSSGTHYIGVERDGYYTIDATPVDVPLGGTKSVNFPLEPIPVPPPGETANDCVPLGTMEIRSTPDHAKITIVDEATNQEIAWLKGLYTDTTTKIPPGTYTVTVEQPNFLTATQTGVEIVKPDCNDPYRERRDLPVDFKLQPIQSSRTCLWPANYTFVDLTINGPDGNPSTLLTVTKITSDEPTVTDKASGGAKYTPDAFITGGAAFQLRAERSGSGDGRVYMITAKDSTGKESTVTVCVPHDLNPDGGTCECNDSGQNYDATKK